jgi:Holliday junction resolvasome RuvABC endonuclease subunit
MLETVLPGASLLERHGRFLRFDVPSLSTAGLGATFRRIQTLKARPEYKVENYSIQQCTLEQVFVKLVNEATAKVAKEGNKSSLVVAPGEGGEV